MCEPAYKASLLGVAFSVANCLTLLCMPKLADRVGRKWIFKITRIADCVLYTIVLFSNNYYATLIALIGLGACTSGRLNVGVPYMNEWFPTRTQTVVQVVRLMEQASVFVFSMLYFWLIDNES